MEKINNVLVIPISELRFILDFMPEYNEPSGDSDTTMISWNDLMPVVEKIEDIISKISDNTPYDESFNGTINTDIKVAYGLVVEFIKWYNNDAYNEMLAFEKSEGEPEAVRFAKWLKNIDNGTEHWNPTTKEATESIGFSPNDCFHDDLMTVEELYQEFLKLKG